MKLKLITGDVDLASPGNYVIASGCGSGKTSCVVDLVKNHWEDGVLYSARTIEECELMKEYLEDAGITDILMLHSGSDSVNIYQNSPDSISNYKVVICTHHKWMNTPTDLLLSLRTSDESVPPHMRYWVLNATALRKWVLIDEMIDRPGFSTYVESSVMVNLKMGIDSGVIRKTQWGYDYRDIQAQYKKYHEMIGQPLNQNSLRAYKTEYTLSLLAENFDYYWDTMSHSDSDRVEVTYTLLDSLPGRSGLTPLTRPYFLIFDGTGDIFYKNSNQLQIIRTEDRYNSTIKIDKFEFGLNRYTPQTVDNFMEELTKCCDRVADIINKHKKTLVLSWMSIKCDLNTNLSGINYIAQNFNYYEEVKELLDLRATQPYELIYYQSGLDRAVNCYLDCDAIVFMGTHKVHSLALCKYNQYNKTSISQLDYQAQLCVQAICRTQIRLHDPNTITNVYFSSDWNPDVIKYVEMYINKNASIGDIYQSIYAERWLDNILPRWKSKVELLDDYFDGCIKQHILSMSEDTTDELVLDIYKHRLNELIPNAGSIHNYDRLLEYLKTFNIKLIILIPDDRYLKISLDGTPCSFTIKQNELEEYVKKGYTINTRFTEYNV